MYHNVVKQQQQQQKKNTLDHNFVLFVDQSKKH